MRDTPLNTARLLLPAAHFIRTNYFALKVVCVLLHLALVVDFLLFGILLSHAVYKWKYIILFLLLICPNTCPTSWDQYEVFEFSHELSPTFLVTVLSLTPKTAVVATRCLVTSSLFVYWLDSKVHSGACTCFSPFTESCESLTANCFSSLA